MTIQKYIDQTLKLKHRYYIYDIETYPNIFTFAIENPLNSESGKRVFEISARKNDIRQLIRTLQWLGKESHKLVGYNNRGFDYPVIHYLMTEVDCNLDGNRICDMLYAKAMSIINSPFGSAFNNIIWPNDQLVSQVDLFLIHHFDNKAKMTSLKMLEVNMRSKNIRDLPYKPGTILTDHEMDVLIEYNKHDVSETLKFFFESLPQIAFREKLSDQYNKDMMCDNDMKIGKNYFISELESRLGKNICFQYVDGQRQPRQTIRETIDIGEIMFDCVNFNSDAFNTVKQWLSSQIITETKGVFNDIPYNSLLDNGNVVSSKSSSKRGRRIIITQDGHSNITQYMDQKEQEKKIKAKGKDGAVIKNLHVNYKGFKFDFGTGGLHGSAPSGEFHSTKQKVIRIADVS